MVDWPKKKCVRGKEEIRIMTDLFCAISNRALRGKKKKPATIPGLKGKNKKKKNVVFLITQDYSLKWSLAGESGRRDGKEVN